MTPNQLHTARKRLGLSQAGLGELLDYSGRQVRYFEAGKSPIPKAVALAVEHLVEHQTQE